MPSNITTPASLVYTGGALRCSRIVPARLRYTPGSFVSSKDSSTSSAAAVPKLDRLYNMTDKIDGETDKQFQRRQLIWQQTMQAIEAAFAATNARVDDNAAILARLTAVEAVAEVANDNAAAAQQTAVAIQTATENTFNDIDPNLGQDFNERLDP